MPPRKAAPPRPQKAAPLRVEQTVRSLPDRPISALITDELPKAKEHELAPWCMAIADRIDKELVNKEEAEVRERKLIFCETFVVQFLRIAHLTCGVCGLSPETSLDDLEAHLRGRLNLPSF